MKYALRGITAEELSYTMNRVKADPNKRFEIKPQFTRGVKRVKENDSPTKEASEFIENDIAKRQESFYKIAKG